MSVVRVGLLGCGTVGQALVRMLAERRATIERASGHRIEVGPILVRDRSRSRPGVDPGLLTDDPGRVIDDPDVAIVVEVMGGLEPTRDHIERALDAGKAVVTANKQLMSRHGAELLERADRAGTELRFEASVCGAIPVIKVLRESLLAAEITTVAGIVNGTTNFILSRMRRDGQRYEDALALAQSLGYAEADPTDDVGGADAAAKLAILASIAFHTRVRFDDVPYEGIDGLQREDIELAERLGYVVKLLAVGRLADGAVTARVHPHLVARDHPLAAVEGSENAVLLESGMVRRIMLQGPGAGGTETASSILADVLSVLGTHRGSFLHNAMNDAARPVGSVDAGRSAFYLRMEVDDRPGVLAAIASIMSQEGVSISTVLQQGGGEHARLVLILHEAPEGYVRRAVERLADLTMVRGEPIVLRVLESGPNG